MEAVLEVISLHKSFGSVPALKGVSLNLAEGMTHVLLGSSGSGKTTLLRAMLGLIETDEGRILFRGKPAAEQAGYVPQGGGLFPHMTAAQNASISARAQNWSFDRIAQRTDELAKLVALERGLLLRRPSELSGGQRQRVALMRAAFTDPGLLLLDEPLSALDPLIRADLQSELKEIFSRLRKTVVFVTHDLGEAAYLGDNIVLMHEGKVVQEGKIADLRDRPASPFVTRFLSAQRILE